MANQQTLTATPPAAAPSEACPGSIRDRFAAHVLDVALCTLFLFAAVDAIVRQRGAVIIATYAGDLHASPATMVAVAFAAIVLLYFFLSEAIAGTTLGKRLCGLAVRRGDRDRPCGPIAAFVRTLLRPIDLVIGVPLIVFSKTRQRFGDQIADTFVIDTRGGASSRRARQRAVEAPVAGWERRTKATMLDLTLLVAAAAVLLFAVGAIDTQSGLRLTLRPALTITAGAAILLYFAVSEALGGTPGQRAAGLRVVQGDATPCGFAASTLRTVCRPIDLGTLGAVSYILLRTSGRSLADLVAATRVVPSPQRVDADSSRTAGSAALRTPTAWWLAAGTATAIGAAAGLHAAPATFEQPATGRGDDQDVRLLIAAVLQKGCGDPDYHAVGGVPCWKLAAAGPANAPDAVLEEIGRTTKRRMTQLTQLTRAEDAMCARGVVNGRPGGAAVGPSTPDQFASAIVSAAREEALAALQPGGLATLPVGMMLSVPGVTQVQYHYQGLVNGPETRTFRIAGRVDGDLARPTLHLSMDGPVDGAGSLLVESTVNYSKSRSSFPAWSPFLGTPGDLGHSPVRAGLTMLSATATSRVTGRQRNGVPAWQEFEYAWTAEKMGGLPSDIVRSGASTAPEYAQYPYGGDWIGVGWGSETRFRQSRKAFVGQVSRAASNVMPDGDADGAVMSLNVKHHTVFYFHVDYDGTVSGRGTITYTLDPNLCGLAVLTRQVNERINFMKYLPSVFAATRELGALAVRRFQSVSEGAPGAITSRVDETLRTLPRLEAAAGEAEIAHAVAASRTLPKAAVRTGGRFDGTNYAIAEIEVENFASRRVLAPGNGKSYPNVEGVSPPTPKNALGEYAGRFKTRTGQPGWFEDGRWFTQSKGTPTTGARWDRQELIVENLRGNDSELRLLEDLAARLPSKAQGTIKLYTQRPPCSSCAGVVEQFSELFPRILIVVTSGG